MESPIPVETEAGRRKGGVGREGVVELEHVIDSVYEFYPLLEIAVLERVVAAGRRLEASGAFDLQLRAESMNEPLGFYQGYRAAAGFQQPLWRGGYFDGGYRIGAGSFAPWYGERQTDDGGEFAAALVLPWLRDRRIDERRTRLLQAGVDLAAVDPQIQTEFIGFVREASIAYWLWVAAGRVAEANRRLYELALVRQTAIERRIEQGEEAPIDAKDNQRLIVSRRATWIQSQQRLRDAAIRLSLYLRDGEGMPVVADEARLPKDFPPPEDRRGEQVDEDVAVALTNRPELASLDYQRRVLELELAQAENTFLPRVDSYLAVRDDVGGWASPKGDKAPTELEAGVSVNVPLQRRTARGKISQTRGKLSQLNQKLRFTRDKIAAEVQAAVNDLTASYERIGFAKEGVELAALMSQVERTKFEQGESNLLDVNLREEQAVNAELAEIDAEFDYFRALANLRAAQGLDGPRARALRPQR
jgi:outer membrane protein TolC